MIKPVNIRIRFVFQRSSWHQYGLGKKVGGQMKVVKIVQAGENGNIVIIEEKDQKRWLQ